MDDMEDYERPIVAIDVIIFTIHDNALKVLLIKRSGSPFKDALAIPGCFVGTTERLEDAVARVLAEKVGTGDVGYSEQLYTFGDVGRDPRARVVSVSYLALVNHDDVAIDPTASGSGWHDVEALPRLAFDHESILAYAVKRLRWKVEYTTATFSFLPRQFTMGQLKRIYEIIFKRKLDKANFYKKFRTLKILREVGTIKGNKKPSKLYELTKDVGDIVAIFGIQQ